MIEALTYRNQNANKYYDRETHITVPLLFFHLY